MEILLEALVLYVIWCVVRGVLRAAFGKRARRAQWKDWKRTERNNWDASGWRW